MRRKPRILIGKRSPPSSTILRALLPPRSALEIIFHLSPCIGAEVTGLKSVSSAESQSWERSARCTRFGINVESSRSHFPIAVRCTAILIKVKISSSSTYFLMFVTYANRWMIEMSTNFQPWSFSASLPLSVACSAICQGSLDRRRREAVTKCASRKKRNEEKTSTFGKVIFPKGNSRERQRLEEAFW